MTSRRPRLSPLAIPLAVAIIGCVGCERSPEEEPTETRTESAAPTIPEPERAWLTSADVVFVGEVKSIGPKSTFHTGFSGTARQTVVYRVIRWLRDIREADNGTDRPRTISVKHAIIDGPTANDDGVSLDPSYFREGATLLVATEPSTGDSGEIEWLDDSERTCPIDGQSVEFHAGERMAVDDLARALANRDR